jgi:hypothetical protein
MSPRPREEEKQWWVDKRVHPYKWTEEEFSRYAQRQPALSRALSVRSLDGDADDDDGERWEQELFAESAKCDASPCYPTPDAGATDTYTLAHTNAHHRHTFVFHMCLAAAVPNGTPSLGLTSMDPVFSMVQGDGRRE